MALSLLDCLVLDCLVLDCLAGDPFGERQGFNISLRRCRFEGKGEEVGEEVGGAPAGAQAEAAPTLRRCPVRRGGDEAGAAAAGADANDSGRPRRAGGGSSCFVNGASTSRMLPGGVRRPLLGCESAVRRADPLGHGLEDGSGELLLDGPLALGTRSPLALAARTNIAAACLSLSTKPPLTYTCTYVRGSAGPPRSSMRLRARFSMFLNMVWTDSDSKICLPKICSRGTTDPLNSFFLPGISGGITTPGATSLNSSRSAPDCM